jgi:hypothetical protein
LHPAPSKKTYFADKDEHQQKTDDGHFRVALFAVFIFFHAVGFDGYVRCDS